MGRIIHKEAVADADTQDPRNIRARYNALANAKPPDSMEIQPGSTEWMSFFANCPLDIGVLLELVAVQAAALKVVYAMMTKFDVNDPGPLDDDLRAALAPYATVLARTRRACP